VTVRLETRSTACPAFSGRAVGSLGHPSGVPTPAPGARLERAVAAAAERARGHSPLVALLTNDASPQQSVNHVAERGFEFARPISAQTRSRR
jgi:hypothetical protein